VITFSVKFSYRIARNVAMIELGMATAEMIVGRDCGKN